MQTTSATSNTSLSHGLEVHGSGVSWSAIIAGAFVTAALALILLALGAGVGLSSVSFWSGTGASATTVSAGAILWLIFMQVVSASMGGYLAGRLRTKWVSIHSDEVYFRDTAHGFISWALATVVAAAFLTTAAASFTGTPSTSQKGEGDRGTGPNAYYVDTLLRADGEKPEGEGVVVRNEVSAILAHGLIAGDLTPADRAYLTQVVVKKTGLAPDAASQRVSSFFVDAKQSADSARKAVAHSLLWAFLALLIGAFCASLSATIGGRQRDHVVLV